VTSVSFDHAAEIYDETRALPPAVADRLTEALVQELRRARVDRLLEIGVGTGRIARPLLTKGLSVTGVDIAPRMLSKLREQLDASHRHPDLLLADATMLPLAARSFPAVLIVHVLHLVSSPSTAIAELCRVLEPGGVFIHHFTRYGDNNPWRASLDIRTRILETHGVALRPRWDEMQMEEKLRSDGGSLHRAVYASDEERSTPRAWLERTRNRIDSWSWEVPESVFPEFIAAYEDCLREHYGDLDRVIRQRVTYELEVWTFSG
jgi:ubiquinone/menaquinone biosynthesis C-methylase UbiE